MTEGIEPLKILTSEAIKAKWKNEGLPSDNMSFENASIISSCSRWPLLIDPQLQGGNSLLKGNSSSCCKFLCLFFLDVGFELFLVGFSLFFLSVGRFALHFLDKFVSLSSLLFDLHHFDFELLLKSQDL